MARSKRVNQDAKRLEYAKEIESKIRAWSPGELFRLSMVHLAFFLVAPLSVFKPRQILSPLDQTEEFLLLGLTTVPPLIRHFLEQLPVSRDNNGNAISQAERNKCRERDGDACVWTGNANPRVCHILPLS
ncbi:hypothetical protein ACHAPT_007093 [Fusarium lateritium]